MAGVKISGLPAVGSAALTDIFPVVQSGITSQESLTQVLALFQGKITSLGTQVQSLNMGGFLINNGITPVLSSDYAIKGYVDSVAQGLNPKPASEAATTGALTAIYNNGSSGIGATLTNSGAQAAFAVDGYSANLNDLILVKNQASSLQNGLYTVTTVGDGTHNWVLTRSVYMDQPTEFLGGYTFVINGTLNAGRSFVETATVTTVGTDAVTFVQFSQSKQLTVTSQSFTSNGTYTPTAGMIYCIVEIVGGGGGGGGGQGSAGNSGQGGGGGGGGYCRKIYTSALIGATAAVVVGTSANGGAAGNNNGTAGNNSTFTPAGAGAVLTGGGGGAGNGGSQTTTVMSVIGAAGGSATNGDINIPGGNGEGGVVVSGSAGVCACGGGGASFFGMFQGNRLSGTGTYNGNNYGGGGAGGVANSGAGAAGGNGAPGFVLITEFNLV